MGPLIHQHMTTLHRVLNDTAPRLSIWSPIIVTPGLLKLTLALGSCLEHRDDLGLGIYKFGLVQHISATGKVLKAQYDQHRIITGVITAPSLADVSTLTATDGVSLPDNLSMAQGGNTQIRVVLGTLCGTNHPTSLEMKEVNVDIM